ncbi:MAG: GEVED domain-containing protein, partial [Candidatus Latescibacterota bacterium]
SAQDFGDAPDPSYPTLLASNGARHTIIQGAFMGALIDPEPDGIPHPNALGDDITNLPDEDGITVIIPPVPGQMAHIDVTVSLGGWLDAWIDYNQNGSWLDPGEKIYAGVVSAGVNPITFMVPAGAFPGPTMSRWRYNLGGLVLAPTGSAPDGEVEDHELFIEEPQEELDFGDAPDRPYPTLLANNGARHSIVPGVFMGNQIDGELDGQPDPVAMGDDLAGLPDEDGVTWLTPFIPGWNAQVDVLVSVDGWLDIWFDFNINGSWFDAIDLAYSGPVLAGVNTINFPVPASALPGQTFARFRYNTGGPLTPDGYGQDGEVEDYEVFIEDPPTEDFGDAPDSYRTLLGSNGAHHTVFANMYMGATIDAEYDGQPDGSATGDDLANIDDEDGVVLTSLLNPIGNATVDVTVSVAGHLDAWIDWDNNGVFDPSDQIFAAQPVVPGVNSLTFFVPSIGKGAPPFDTFSRWRYSIGGGLPPDGPAPEGEVEDYMVHVEEDVATAVEDGGVPEKFALQDAVPNPFNPQTTLSFSLPTASHVKLAVYDVSGRLVKTLVDENRTPGVHHVVWDGRDAKQRQVASGVYFYSIEAGSFTETKRMVLVK